MTLVIIGAAGLLMAFGAALLGIGELELGYTGQKGAEALSVADGCMEDTMRRMRLDTNYGVAAGTLNLTIDSGSCTIDVTDLGSGQRRIVVTGTIDTYNKRIQTDLTLTGNVISIDSWQELST